MQCPETPQLSTRQALESPNCTTFDTGTPRRRITSYGSVQRSSPGRGVGSGTENPFGSVSTGTISRKHTPNAASPCTTNFSRHLSQSHQLDDIFESQTRASAAALQFQQAARRLALSPISQSLQNQNTTKQGHNEHRWTYRDISLATYNSRGNDTPLCPRHPEHRTYIERDITSARKESTHGQPFRHRNDLPPIPLFSGSSCGSPNPFDLRKRQAPGKKMLQTPRNFSRPTPVADLSPARTRARNFSRPSRPIHPKRQSKIKSYTPSTVDIVTSAPMSLTPSREVDRTDNASKRPSRVNEGADAVPGLEPSSKSLDVTNTLQDETTQDQAQSHEITPAHNSVRESFESAVSDCLGDKRLQLSKWEIWLQRIMFTLFVFAANIALGLAYLGSFKHPYMLPILVFMKSKDVLSTMVNLLGFLHTFLRQLTWPPKKPEPRWILSLVCAYAETEEQILKTVFSLARSTTQPHRQVICIILDGMPRNILGRMSAANITVQRPYTTWRGGRGEITVNAGHLDGVPLIVVEKARNAGKKDSLILGHDLFNYPRKDMPQSTQMLRKEIWQTVLPAVVVQMKGGFDKFDFVFCTDADSTIHDQALRRLADALCQEDNAIAACGVLFAEFGGKKTEYSPWHLFQQFQYTFGQYVRRQAESMWGRVTCLPGCVTMIAVRPETGQAVSEYARPVTEHNLFRHQVQYLGTDRRLTWCMMTQGKHLRTVFVPDAVSETVVPDSISHYLSQRRRWASNAYFNDFFYLLGPRQRLVTRLFAAIDIVRLTLVYYRVFNTGYFMHGLITHFYIVKIIPTLIVTKTPATWYLLLVLIREPILRRRLHKILLGMCINQIISPILSVIVFTNVLFHMGSQAWGKTGASTQGASSGAVSAPVPSVLTPPSQSWTPRRLATSVRAAIRGVTPKRLAKIPGQSTVCHAQRDDPKSELQVTRSVAHSSPLKSNLPDLSNVTTTPMTTALSPGPLENTQSDANPAACTPSMRPRQNLHSTPSVLTWRTPDHRRRARSKLNPVNTTPVRMTDDCSPASA